ncbi:MAG: hypothetical protein M1416_02445 [Candidatus Pacearchaeota archaeon]|nr:hypothetical protein [Candidatus Pacearchaeota archaeon]
MLSEILLAGIFFLAGILTQMIGINIADKRNHQRNLERLEKEHNYRVRYMQKETFFKKKLKDFEKKSRRIWGYINYDITIISGIKKMTKESEVKEIEILEEKMGKDDALSVNSLPLYSDTLEQTGDSIMKFLKAQIRFNEIISKNKKIKSLKENIPKLEEIFIEIADSGGKAITEMRQELLSD